MGGKSSKHKNEELPIIDATENGSEIIIESEDMYDRQVINVIKNELQKRPERFLLNNLLMCLVFFKNYEKDLYDFSNTAAPKEEHDLNIKLVKEVKKCILPDSLLDKIKENLIYSDENEKENKQEQLSHKRIYLINDNIEVKDRNDKARYTTIDVPGCQVEIEESDEYEDLSVNPTNNEEEKKKIKERKGFLKLRLLRNSSKELPSRSVSMEQPPPVPPKSTTQESGESEESSSDEYSTIIDLKTPKGLNIIKTTERRETLPDICFETRKMRRLSLTVSYKEPEKDYGADDSEEDADENDDDDDDDEVEPDENKDKLYEEVMYLSSKGFMEYFQNEVFPNATGKLLGFSEKAIESALAVSGTILCDTLIAEEKRKCQVIPAVAIDWPSQAVPYTYRKSRNTIIDKRNGVIYRWPTNDMIDDLRSFNCVVIPQGFVMKRGENKDSDIEWEIHFPKAARYLEMRMTHPQVRCYIFLLAIYKTYIEKITTYQGLLIEHLRTHMFWECEQNAKDWPEHMMGSKVLKVIEDLNSGLSVSRIPHYFISERNILENIPSKYLQFAHKTFHNVLQFPVMHFLKALKNLKYTQTDFYPAPDLDLLQKILTKKGFKEQSKKKLKRKESTKKKRASVVQVGSQRHKQRKQIGNLRWKKNIEKINRQKHKEIQKKKEEEEIEKEKKAVDDEADLKMSFSNLGVLTQISVLEFFIQHFIRVARKSRIMGPKGQTLLYLKQAWYNNKVLEDISGACDSTRNTEIIIKKEREWLEKENPNDLDRIAPPTPHRNEQNAFIFHKKEPGKSDLKLKPSIKLDSSSEVVLRRKENKVFKRQRSVGFDDNVEKISFT